MRTNQPLYSSGHNQANNEYNSKNSLLQSIYVPGDSNVHTVFPTATILPNLNIRPESLGDSGLISADEVYGQDTELFFQHQQRNIQHQPSAHNEFSTSSVTFGKSGTDRFISRPTPHKYQWPPLDNVRIPSAQNHLVVTDTEINKRYSKFEPKLSNNQISPNPASRFTPEVIFGSNSESNNDARFARISNQKLSPFDEFPTSTQGFQSSSPIFHSEFSTFSKASQVFQPISQSMPRIIHDSRFVAENYKPPRPGDEFPTTTNPQIHDHIIWPTPSSSSESLRSKYERFKSQDIVGKDIENNYVLFPSSARVHHPDENGPRMFGTNVGLKPHSSSGNGFPLAFIPSNFDIPDAILNQISIGHKLDIPSGLLWDEDKAELQHEKQSQDYDSTHEVVNIEKQEQQVKSFNKDELESKINYENHSSQPSKFHQIQQKQDPNHVHQSQRVQKQELEHTSVQQLDSLPLLHSNQHIQKSNLFQNTLKFQTLIQSQANKVRDALQTLQSQQLQIGKQVLRGSKIQKVSPVQVKPQNLHLQSVITSLNQDQTQVQAKPLFELPSSSPSLPDPTGQFKVYETSAHNKEFTFQISNLQQTRQLSRRDSVLQIQDASKSSMDQTLEKDLGITIEPEEFQIAQSLDKQAFPSQPVFEEMYNDQARLEKSVTKELCQESINYEESYKFAIWIFKKECITIMQTDYASWLGSDSPNRALIRKAYMDLYDFTGISILLGLRRVCKNIYMKAESQQLDRLMDAYANRWTYCNPTHGFKDVGVVYTLSYSILLLNTDHCANKGQKSKKMSRIQYTNFVMEAIKNVFGDLKEHPKSQPPYQKPLVEPLSLPPKLNEKYPLVDDPFEYSQKDWETIVQGILKTIYVSVDVTPLPLAINDEDLSTIAARSNANRNSLVGFKDKLTDYDYSEQVAKNNINPNSTNNTDDTVGFAAALRTSLRKGVKILQSGENQHTNEQFDPSSGNPNSIESQVSNQLASFFTNMQKALNSGSSQNPSNNVSSLIAIDRAISPRNLGYPASRHSSMIITSPEAINAVANLRDPFGNNNQGGHGQGNSSLFTHTNDDQSDIYGLQYLFPQYDGSEVLENFNYLSSAERNNQEVLYHLKSIDDSVRHKTGGLDLSTRFIASEFPISTLDQPRLSQSQDPGHDNFPEQVFNNDIAMIDDQDNVWPKDPVYVTNGSPKIPNPPTLRLETNVSKFLNPENSDIILAQLQPEPKPVNHKIDIHELQRKFEHDAEFTMAALGVPRPPLPSLASMVPPPGATNKNPRRPNILETEKYFEKNHDKIHSKISLQSWNSIESKSTLSAPIKQKSPSSFEQRLSYTENEKLRTGSVSSTGSIKLQKSPIKSPTASLPKSALEEEPTSKESSKKHTFDFYSPISQEYDIPHEKEEAHMRKISRSKSLLISPTSLEASKPDEMIQNPKEKFEDSAMMESPTKRSDDEDETKTIKKSENGERKKKRELTEAELLLHGAPWVKEGLLQVQVIREVDSLPGGEKLSSSEYDIDWNILAGNSQFLKELTEEEKEEKEMTNQSAAGVSRIACGKEDEWINVFVVLQQGYLKMYKFDKDFIPSQLGPDPDAALIKTSLCDLPPSKTKKVGFMRKKVDGEYASHLETISVRSTGSITSTIKKSKKSSIDFGARHITFAIQPKKPDFNGDIQQEVGAGSWFERATMTDNISLCNSVAQIVHIGSEGNDIMGIIPELNTLPWATSDNSTIIVTPPLPQAAISSKLRRGINTISTLAASALPGHSSVMATISQVMPSAASIAAHSHSLASPQKHTSSVMRLNGGHSGTSITALDGRRFVLILPNKTVLLFRAGTQQVAEEFVYSCNYWAARVSKEPLSEAVTSNEYGWDRPLETLFDIKKFGVEEAMRKVKAQEILDAKAGYDPELEIRDYKKYNAKILRIQTNVLRAYHGLPIEEEEKEEHYDYGYNNDEGAIVEEENEIIQLEENVNKQLFLSHQESFESANSLSSASSSKSDITMSVPTTLPEPLTTQTMGEPEGETEEFSKAGTLLFSTSQRSNLIKIILMEYLAMGFKPSTNFDSIGDPGKELCQVPGSRFHLLRNVIMDILDRFLEVGVENEFYSQANKAGHIALTSFAKFVTNKYSPLTMDPSYNDPATQLFSQNVFTQRMTNGLVSGKDGKAHIFLYSGSSDCIYVEGQRIKISRWKESLPSLVMSKNDENSQLRTLLRHYKGLQETLDEHMRRRVLMERIYRARPFQRSQRVSTQFCVPPNAHPSNHKTKIGRGRNTNLGSSIKIDSYGYAPDMGATIEHNDPNQPFPAVVPSIMYNWELRANYLLREIMKYDVYTETLRLAREHRDQLSG